MMTLFQALEESTTTRRIPMPQVEDQGNDFAATTLCIVIEKGTLGNSKKVESTLVKPDAKDKAIRVSKILLDSPELDAIRHADSELMSKIDALCLPYETGARLVPHVNVSRVYRLCRDHAKMRAEHLVPLFMAVYRQRKDEAPARLGNLYDPEDYPTAKEVEDSFYFNYKFKMFGTVPPELQQLDGEIYEEERQKMAAHMQDLAEESAGFVRECFAELLTHLGDRLTPDADGKEKVFQKTTVTKLTQWLENFPALNSALNDAQLAPLVEQARAMMTGVTPEKLRNSESFRRRVSEQIQAISKQVEVIRRPTRKFKD